MKLRSLLYVFCFVVLFGSSTLGAYADERGDSTVVFKFKVSRSQFWYDFQGNRAEFDKLAQFLYGNRARIQRGEMPIYVDGYTTSMPSEAENLELAKIRSNHVKSYLISMYGFREPLFRTRNHVDSLGDLSDVVTVSLTVPVEKKRREEPVIVSTATNLSSINLDTDSIVWATAPTSILVDKDPPMSKHWWKDQLFEGNKAYSLLEKGSYYFSLYASFNQARTSDLLIEPLFDIHSIYNAGFEFNVAGGYFVDNNVAIGAYGGYSFSDVRVDVSSDLLQLLINSKQYETNNVSAGFNVGVFVKNFIPIEYTNRIYLVNETSLHYSQKSSLQRNVFDKGAMLSKVYQNTYMGGLRLSVGIMYFLKPGLTLEFNISPVAAYYSYNEVVNNEVLKGRVCGGSVLTVLMPLDLRFGVSYFLGLDYKRHRRYIEKLHNTVINH